MHTWLAHLHSARGFDCARREDPEVVRWCYDLPHIIPSPLPQESTAHSPSSAAAATCILRMTWARRRVKGSAYPCPAGNSKLCPASVFRDREIVPLPLSSPSFAIPDCRRSCHGSNRGLRKMPWHVDNQCPPLIAASQMVCFHFGFDAKRVESTA
ncbi:hypothetical protein F5Y05DRAFT_7280 [Hypoxylon sp. FL0543]|nr:hypothetical protein F5Y05DRAFT_7280 [Hypoxylon sp. FL0543]